MKRNFQILIWLISVVLFVTGCNPYNGGEPIQTGLPDKSAFIILDIQNDFMLPTGRLPIDQGQSSGIIRNINKLTAGFGKNHMDVIYIGNEFKESDTVANWFRNNSAIKGTEGAKLVAELNVINTNYFAKEHPDAFTNKLFDQFLRDRKITKLIIAGVFGDQCVLSTVKAALNRKFEVTIVSDAIGTKTDKKLANILETYKKIGVGVEKTDQLVSRVSSMGTSL